MRQKGNTTVTDQKKQAQREGIEVLIRNIRIPYTEPPRTAMDLAEKKLLRAMGPGKGARIMEGRIFKESVDARKKPDIRRVVTVLLTVAASPSAIQTAERRDKDVARFSETPLSVVRGRRHMAHRPLVVGFGPAGMFAALLLAEHGMPPVILERGDDVEERARAVERFYKTKVLDTHSNIQFGAGGAGTFSDGKLVTRIGDPLCSYILSRFVSFGAPETILTRAKPHVGTDVLLRVVANVRNYLKALGCTFYFRTAAEDILFSQTGDGRQAVAVRTAAGDIPCGALLLAIGHSARDTYHMLGEREFSLQPKPFSVGVRIEHLQSDMNEAAYGTAAKHTLACGATGRDILLPPAEYAVSHREGAGEDARGVYSFCMCPGGEVMAATSEEGGVVVNGMSRSGRDGRNANAALAVSVHPADYGATPWGAIAYQRRLEQAAFALGGGTYAAPAQTVGDFLTHKSGTSPSRVTPSYMDGFVEMRDLHTVLPAYVSSLLEVGIRRFEGQYPGFSASDAILTGVETRTSAPLRIHRGETYLADGCTNIYPIGEGAGYAGGITSAAADGMHAALAILARYDGVTPEGAPATC